MGRKVRLKWGASLEAQRAADAAFLASRRKKKPTPAINDGQPPKRKRRRKRKPFSYPAYLRSAHWKATRLRKLASAGGKCECCGRPADQVHHKHYGTLKHEQDKDLEALCGGCHLNRHETDKGLMDPMTDAFVTFCRSF